MVGATNLEAAASYAAFAALKELVLQGKPDQLELSRALWGATTFRGGSAELVLQLLEPRFPSSSLLPLLFGGGLLIKAEDEEQGYPYY